MAAVLTLFRTLSGRESCSFSGLAETPEAPADEEDTDGRRGLISSGMRVTLDTWAPATRTSPQPLPPIGYHASIALSKLFLYTRGPQARWAGILLPVRSEDIGAWLPAGGSRRCPSAIKDTLRDIGG
jgi:hypothetical protein